MPGSIAVECRNISSNSNTSPGSKIGRTIPGSPAYVAKASTFRMKNRAVGVDVDLRNHNAIQGQFAFEA